MSISDRQPRVHLVKHIHMVFGIIRNIIEDMTIDGFFEFALLCLSECTDNLEEVARFKFLGLLLWFAFFSFFILIVLVKVIIIFVVICYGSGAS